MNERQQLQTYLSKAKTMQVATVRDGSPWISTVYFVVDSDLHFYWLSLPERRHSLEIKDDARAAIAVAIKTDLPVIGVQAEGVVTVENDREKVKMIAAQYSEKYDGSGKSFYERFASGINQHWVYKFSPGQLQLFDEVHFKEDPKRKII